MPLLGYVMEGEYPSLVSEWMVKGSLRAYMGSLKRIESSSMILDIACGLAYMHKRGAIHSDLKSDNVLVTPDDRAVLTDFGASRMDSLSSGYSTSGCRVVGSMQWLAVEFFPLDDSPPPAHTMETDVWAFGMTVYELLVKNRPYYHIRNPCSVMWIIAKGGLPKKPEFSEGPSDLRIEEFMWSLCNDCWKKDPKSRPTMNDLELRIREEIDSIAVS